MASVLITSGILMLLDAGLTLAWQEPVSAYFAAQAQGDLDVLSERGRRALRIHLDDVEAGLQMLAGALEQALRQLPQ